MAKRTASAKKQARAGARRSVRNRAAKSSVKTLIVKARRAMAESPGAGSAESDRQAAAVDALRALDRAAAKRILHPNNAARRKSRLARRLAKLTAAGAGSASGTGSGKGKKPAPSAPAASSTKKK